MFHISKKQLKCGNLSLKSYINTRFWNLLFVVSRSYLLLLYLWCFRGRATIYNNYFARYYACTSDVCLKLEAHLYTKSAYCSFLLFLWNIWYTNWLSHPDKHQTLHTMHDKSRICRLLWSTMEGCHCYISLTFWNVESIGKWTTKNRCIPYTFPNLLKYWRCNNGVVWV